MKSKTSQNTSQVSSSGFLPGSQPAPVWPCSAPSSSSAPPPRGRQAQSSRSDGQWRRPRAEKERGQVVKNGVTCFIPHPLRFSLDHTHLEHNDKRQSDGEKMEVLREVIAVCIPETLIPAGHRQH